MIESRAIEMAPHVLSNISRKSKVMVLVEEIETSILTPKAMAPEEEMESSVRVPEAGGFGHEDYVVFTGEPEILILEVSIGGLRTEDPSIRRARIPRLKWKRRRPVLGQLPLLLLRSSYRCQLPIYSWSRPSLQLFLLLHKVTIEHNSSFSSLLITIEQLFLKFLLQFCIGSAVHVNKPKTSGVIMLRDDAKVFALLMLRRVGPLYSCRLDIYPIGGLITRPLESIRAPSHFFSPNMALPSNIMSTMEVSDMVRLVKEAFEYLGVFIIDLCKAYDQVFNLLCL